MSKEGEALMALVKAGDVDGCVAWLVGHEEKQRTRARADVRRQARATERAAWAVAPELGALRAMRFRDGTSPRERQAFTLACLGTCSARDLSSISRLSLAIPGDDVATTIAVLAARPDDVRRDLVEWILAELGHDPRAFAMVRRMVRGGLVPWPPGAARSWLSERAHVALGPPSFEEPTSHPADPGLSLALADALSSDRTEIDALLPRVFDTEWRWLGVEGVLPGALRVLAERGTPSRATVMDLAVAGLIGEAANPRGCVAVVDELRPSVAELSERAGRLLDMLESRAPAAQSFALAKLVALQRAGKLDAAAALARLRPAVEAKTKGVVSKALGLLEDIAESHPDLASEAARVAGAAAGHEAPWIREVALRLAATAPAPSPKSEDRVDDRAASQATSADVDPEWLALARVAVATDAAARGVLPSALDLDFHAVPRLDPTTRIIPLAAAGDLDDLLDLLGRLLEGKGSALDFERALDGVSRLCDVDAPDLPRRAGPLLRRAALILCSDGRELPEGFQLEAWAVAVANGIARLDTTVLREGLAPAWAERMDTPGRMLAWLIAAWLGAHLDVDGSFTETGERLLSARMELPAQPARLGTFHLRRAGGVASRAARRMAAPALAMPTHAGRWIDPFELIERLRTWSAAEIPLDPADMAQALLRLAPDHRASALARLRDAALPAHECLDALAHALGADSVNVGTTRGLWMSAARARSPFGDDEAVASRWPDPWPDAARAARIEPFMRPVKVAAKGMDAFTWGVAWNIGDDMDAVSQALADSVQAPRHQSPIGFEGPEPPDAPPRDIACVLLHRVDALEVRLGPGEPLTSALAAATWPASCEPLAAHAAVIEWATRDARSWCDRDAVSPMLDPDMPLGPCASAYLAMALGVKDPLATAFACDVLVLSIDDGRIDAARLGRSLQLAMSLAGATPARWGRSLAVIASTSDLHAWVVREAVEHALAGCDIEARQALPLLEILHEQGTRLGLAPRDATLRDRLASLNGSGRSAKLAKALLAAAETPDHPARRAACARALAGRVARARRWQEWAAPA